MYGAPKPSASSPNPPKPYNCCANTKDDDWAGLSEPIDPAQEPDQDQQSTDTDDDIGVDEAQLDTEPAADPPARVPELAATHPPPFHPGKARPRAWRSPHHRIYLVNASGTHSRGDSQLAQAIWRAAADSCTSFASERGQSPSRARADSYESDIAMTTL